MKSYFKYMQKELNLAHCKATINVEILAFGCNRPHTISTERLWLVCLFVAMAFYRTVIPCVVSEDNEDFTANKL
jgi:hypothetical protein